MEKCDCSDHISFVIHLTEWNQFGSSSCEKCKKLWISGRVRCVVCGNMHIAIRELGPMKLDGTQCSKCHKMTSYEITDEC